MTGVMQRLFSVRPCGRGDEKSNAALEDVARQFESLFIQQMLKSMRDDSEGDLMNSETMETYQSMADQQMALQLSREEELAARMMVEQMQTRVRAR